MKWFQLIMMYLPVVLTTVKTVEGITAKGGDKKQMVLDIITAGAQTAESIPNEHVAGIGTMIDVVVTSLNNRGVFTKTAK